MIKRVGHAAVCIGTWQIFAAITHSEASLVGGIVAFGIGAAVVLFVPNLSLKVTVDE